MKEEVEEFSELELCEQKLVAKQMQLVTSETQVKTLREDNRVLVARVAEIKDSFLSIGKGIEQIEVAKNSPELLELVILGLKTKLQEFYGSKIYEVDCAKYVEVLKRAHSLEESKNKLT